MPPRFDLFVVNNRYLIASDDGVEGEGSRFIDAVLQLYALQARGNYSHFLLSYMNFELRAGECRWAWVFEERELVRKRAIAWLRESLALEVKRSCQQEVTFDVTRKDGPINHYARAWSVLRKCFDLAATADFLLRPPKENPFCFDEWERWDSDQQWSHCLRRYGPKKAKHAVRFAGGYFITKDRMPYSPPYVDPGILKDDIDDAVVARLGQQHPVSSMTGVGRDDGPRPEDMRLVTFADYAGSNFDCEFIGSNKGGPTDEVGNRLPCKPIGFSPEVRDRIHRRIDAAHAANPALPNMAMLRRMLADGKWDELAKYYVFAKFGTNEPYSYDGIYYHVVRATAAAKVTVRHGGKDRPATLRWQRRSLHDGEYALIAETSKTPQERQRRLDELTEDRGHKTPQHDNYASWSKHKRVQRLKNERIARDAERRAGRIRQSLGTADPTLSPTRQRLENSRRRPK